MRAAMAGGIIGVMYLVYFSVLAAFAGIGDGDLLGVYRIAGALAFGFALVFIYYSKSELLTSNMMIVSIGAYNTGRSLRLLALCFAATPWAGAANRAHGVGL